MDLLLDILGLPSDSALSRALFVAPSVISRIRFGRLSVGPIMVLRIHDLTNMSVAEIKEMISK